MSDKSFSYADSGVNIEIGDDASRIFFEAAKHTWELRKGTIGDIVSPFDDFSGLRIIDVGNLPEGSCMSMGFDGIGTKAEIAERMNNHSTMAYDLFAMVCDDAVVRGGEPVVIGSVFDVNSLGTEKQPFDKQIKHLAYGYMNAAKDANVAIINGEIAELGKRIGGFGAFNYNWSSAVIWFAKKDRLFTGKEIKVGDKIVALEEEGFRSNGISLVRKILSEKYGGNWHDAEFDGKTLGELVLTPSRIYCKCVCDMFGGFDREAKAEIHGVAHITGGGVPGKLGRILKTSGFGATLSDLLDPCPLMDHCQDIGKVSDEEAYKTWNMGQGMMIVTPDPEKVIEIAYEYEINSQVVGEVTEEKGVRIMSCGRFKKDSLLRF